MHIGIRSPKGGVGVTTVTCGIALALAAQRRYSVIWTARDTVACLGLNDNKFIRLHDNPMSPPRVDSDQIALHDNQPANGPGARNLLVVRNDYLSLWRIVNGRPSRPYDGAIVLANPDGALTVKDCIAAIGVPLLASIPITPQIARSIDAGLLAMRAPEELLGPLSNVLPALSAID